MRCRRLLLVWALTGCDAGEPRAQPDDTETAADDDATSPTPNDVATAAAPAKQRLDPVRIEAPTEPLPSARSRPEPTATTSRSALAWQFNAPIFVAAGSEDILGFARRGAQIEVARARKAPGCDVSWWELKTGGWVCPRQGWTVSASPAPLEERLRTRPPADAPLPFTYAKVKDPRTPLYSRMPTEAEQARAEADPGRPAPVQLRTEGVVFLAIHGRERREDGTWFVRDVRGRYVLESDTHPPKTQTMRGEPLDDEHTLPIAFVYVDDAPLHDDAGVPIGSAEKFSRVSVQGISSDGAWVQTPRGRLPRTSVRLAELAARPEEVGPGDQWMHVDLDRQVLVAYEGDTPVLATLISSGKEGYEPPRGSFRIEKKYTTKKMQGDDPIDGSYDIDQVPYIMYYWGSLALHGAYWHNEFGQVRSHGCTNLPPHDARWLFRWANPTLPQGWHGRVRARGPRLWMTRGAEPYVSPLAPR